MNKLVMTAFALVAGLTLASCDERPHFSGKTVKSSGTVEAVAYDPNRMECLVRYTAGASAMMHVDRAQPDFMGANNHVTQCRTLKQGDIIPVLSDGSVTAIDWNNL